MPKHHPSYAALVAMSSYLPVAFGSVVYPCSLAHTSKRHEGCRAPAQLLPS